MIRISKTIAALIAATAMTAAAGGCAGKKNDSSQTETSAMTSTDSLRQRLGRLAEEGHVAFGHHDDPVYGHTWNGDQGRSDVLETSGDYPAVMSWDLGMIELDSAANLDGVDFDRMRREVLAQDARGGFSVFSWHLRNPADPSTDSWHLADTLVVSKILNDSETGKRFDLWVSRLGNFFNSLRRADGTKVPVVFRPWHEHTGSWFWWGAGLCTPDDYKALWARTRSGLDAAGTDNLLWAYSPDRVASEEQFMERYPGDEYVDIIGVDVYHFGGEEGLATYRRDASRSLQTALAIARSHGKAAAFTETGSESLPMARWWTDVLLPLLKENRGLSYVVVWRNATDKPSHYYAPFAGEPSVESFREFHNDTTTVFAKEMSKTR